MTNSEKYKMNDQSDGTVFLEWPRSHGHVARLVQLKFKGQDALHLRVFYPDLQGNLKPSWSGLTIPVDQIVPLRKALGQLIKVSQTGIEIPQLQGEGCAKTRQKNQIAGKTHWLQGVTAIMDTNAYLLIAILHQAAPRERTEEFDADRFLAERGSEITEAGQVLAYLGLARPDIGAALGWQPTHLLMDVIARRASQHQPQPECADGELTIHLLRDAVFGVGGEGKGELGFRLLLHLGLLQVNDAGNWGATGQLQNLFRDSYYRRHLRKAVAEA